MCQRSCSGDAPSTSLTRRSVSGPIRLKRFPALVVPNRRNGTWMKIDPAAPSLSYGLPTSLWMVETLVQKRGVYGVQQLLAEMKQGRSFDDALQRAFATTTEALWSSLT